MVVLVVLVVALPYVSCSLLLVSCWLYRFIGGLYWFLIGFYRFPYKRSKRTVHKVLFDYAHLIRSVVQVNLSGGSVSF